MTETLSGFIPIDPKPQQRPCTVGRRRCDLSRADKRTFLEMCVIIVGRPENPPTGAVELSMRFVLSERPPQKWPDLDNLIKLVQDALQRAYYVNDRQVCAYGKMSREFTSDPDKIGTHLKIIYPGE
jgi:Holliday junction resolvase RusA-like endonuclease